VLFLACLLRKAVGSDGAIQESGSTSHDHVPLMPEMDLQNLLFGPLGSCLALRPYFLSILFFPLEMETCTLCHCFLEVCNFLFDFTGARR
jgi:hypothetical protein